MENSEWNRVEESPPRCQDTCPFKGKTAKTENKTRRKMKRHEVKLQIGERGCASTTTSRDGSHGQPVVASGWFGLRRFSNTAFCALSSLRALPMLGHFGPLFAIFFDPHGLKTSSNHMCLNL